MSTPVKPCLHFIHNKDLFTLANSTCVCCHFWIVNKDICFLGIYSPWMPLLYGLLFFENVVRTSTASQCLMMFLQLIPWNLHVNNTHDFRAVEVPWEMITGWELDPQYSERPQMMKTHLNSDKKGSIPRRHQTIL